MIAKSSKTLILSDYDDTLFRTDGFFYEVLDQLSQLGFSEKSAAIQSDVEHLRRTLGTSASYDFDGQIGAETYLRLAETMNANNSSRIYSDALRFYNQVAADLGIEFQIATRGPKLWQQLKYSGTIFQSDSVTFDCFNNSNKVDRFIDNITIADGGFRYGAEDTIYERLVVIDNDQRYFQGFDKLTKLGVGAVGYLVYRGNARFYGCQAIAHVTPVLSFDQIKL